MAINKLKFAYKVIILIFCNTIMLVYFKSLNGFNFNFLYNIQQNVTSAKIKTELNSLNEIYTKGGSIFKRSNSKLNSQWVEIQNDKIFYSFEEKIRDKRNLILYDKSRNIQLKFNFYSKSFSSEKNFEVAFCYTNDICQKWNYFDQICISFNSKYYSKDVPFCLEYYEKMDENYKNKVANNPIKIRYIISTTSSIYMTWQSRFSYYWFKKYQPATSTFTRLFASRKKDNLFKEIPSFLTNHYDVPTDKTYYAYNKPYSIQQWIKSQYENINEDIIVILDPDVVMYKDVSYLSAYVREGRPMAQKGFMNFNDIDSNFGKLFKAFCKKCSFADPIAVPVFIHKNDLLKIAPRWYEITKTIRKQTFNKMNEKNNKKTKSDKNKKNKLLNPKNIGKMDKSKNDNVKSDNEALNIKSLMDNKELQLSWTAEMYGYIFAAAELGIKHKIRVDLEEFLMGKKDSKKSKRTLKRPMIHFSMGMIMKNNEYWSKQNKDAVYNIPDAYPENEVSVRLANELRDASINLNYSKESNLGNEKKDYYRRQD